MVLNATQRAVLLSGITTPDNTVAHYDASQLSLNDGDTVSVWPDEQGDNDLDIQTGSPTYVESGINGNPAIAFNGDGLEVTGLSVTQPNTTYLVFEYRSGAWDDGRVLSGVSERQLTAWASPQGNNWGTHAGDDLFGSDDLGIQQMTTVFDGGNSSIRENGVETGVGDPGAEDLGGLSVGYDSWKGGNYADAYVSEIVIVNSGSVDLDFENQLLEKWGITARSPSAIPDSGVLKYNFKDNTATDRWGSFDGTLYGPTYLSGGGPDGTGAFDFDGSNDYITVPEGATDAVESAGEASVYILVKLNDINRDHFLFSQNSSGRLYLYMDADDGGQGYRTASEGVTSNTVEGASSGIYQSVVVTAGPNNGVSVYTDGSLTDSVNGSLDTSIGGLDIGRDTSSLWNLDGEIAEFRMYDRELTALEVSNLDSVGNIY